MFTITDTLGIFPVTTVPTRADVMPVVELMFESDYSRAVDDALVALAGAIDRHEYTGDLETFLGITIS